MDFIKLDAEGGELAVLEGAKEAAVRFSRPAILVEVEDVRTRRRGYPAREIYRQLLGRWNYRFRFALSEMGTLYPASPDDESYNANFVALPNERAEEFQQILAEPRDRARADSL